MRATPWPEGCTKAPLLNECGLSQSYSTIHELPTTLLANQRELSLVLLMDRPKQQILFQVPNTELGWRYHFGCVLQDKTDIASTLLNDHGIVYCPDFLINSGGIANVYHEYLGNYNKERVLASTEHIYNVCLDVLDHSENNKIGSHEAALELALQRIEKVGKVKLGV